PARRLVDHRPTTQTPHQQTRTPQLPTRQLTNSATESVRAAKPRPKPPRTPPQIRKTTPSRPHTSPATTRARNTPTAPPEGQHHRPSYTPDTGPQDGNGGTSRRAAGAFPGGQTRLRSSRHRIIATASRTAHSLHLLTWLDRPAPSGSAGTSCRCRGCSPPSPAFPESGCLPSPGRCDDPAEKAFHVHSVMKRLVAHLPSVENADEAGAHGADEESANRAASSARCRPDAQGGRRCGAGRRSGRAGVGVQAAGNGSGGSAAGGGREQPATGEHRGPPPQRPQVPWWRCRAGRRGPWWAGRRGRRLPRRRRR
ncbi:hypothetical protein OV450_8509, partial [Actinobacteria bacterium OV450]